MGRELKRVPLNFDWELNKVWEGFLNPFSNLATPCPHCEGGYSPEAKQLNDRWYGYVPFKPEDRGSKSWTKDDAPIRALAERNCARTPDFYGKIEADIQREAHRLAGVFNSSWGYHLNADDVAALIEAGRLHDFTHTWTGKEWEVKNPPYIPTPEEVNVWSLSGFGHDSINNWVCVKAECVRLGVSPTCSHCEGHGEIWEPEDKEDNDNWKKEEPPLGEGYQLWETVSEGSPISPVFSTPEGLAEWLSSPDYRIDGGLSKKQWMDFIVGPGWAPSGAAVNGYFMTGVEVVSYEAGDTEDADDTGSLTLKEGSLAEAVHKSWAQG